MDGFESATSSPSWLLNLDKLHALLRAQGFSVSPDRWLNATDLLLGFLQERGLPNDAHTVSRFLAPLFARNPPEQSLFESLFLQWWKLHQPSGTRAQPSLDPVRRIRRRWWLRWLTGWRFWSILVLVILSLVLGWFYHTMRLMEDMAAARQAIERLQTKELGGSAGPDIETGALLPREPPESDLPRFPKPVNPSPELTPGMTALLQALDLSSFTLPPLLFLLLIFRSLIGRRMLRKGRGNADDPLAELRFSGTKASDLFDQPAVRNSLKRLHAPVEVSTARLDIKGTVIKTALRAGVFVPVLAVRAQVPEIVVWVNVRSRHDAMLCLAQTLLQRLKACDLTVTGYTYSSRPDRLRRLGSEEQVSLEEVLVRHAGCRLIIITTTSSLLSAWSDNPVPWLTSAASTCVAAVLDITGASSAFTKPLRNAGVLVETFSGIGIEAATAQLTSLARIHRHQPMSPPDSLRDPERTYGAKQHTSDAQRMLQDLKQYLGAKGLLLLSAVSSYPEFRWELVRLLDASLFAEDEAQDRETRLLKLAQLPWAREGWLPDWLRLQLLRSLSRKDRATVRSLYVGLLSNGAEGGANPIALPIRVTRRSVALLTRYVRWMFYWASRESPLRDRVMAELVLGGWIRRLDFPLPRLWAQLVPQSSTSLAWGWVVSIVAAIGLGSMVSLGWQAFARQPVAQALWDRMPALVDVPLVVSYTMQTAAVAQQLQETTSPSLNVQLRPLAPADEIRQWSREAAVLVYEDGWAEPARWISDRVNYASYGTSVQLIPAQDPLARTLGSSESPLHLFLLGFSASGNVSIVSPIASQRLRVDDTLVTPGAPVEPQRRPASGALVDDLDFGRYFAVVIGNASYQQIASLPTSSNDAARVARILAEKYRFNVQLLLDANDITMLKTINDLGAVVGSNDNVLIYYSGQGERVRSANGDTDREYCYWLPVNADPPPEDRFWVPVEQIAAMVGRLSARRILVIADSCFEGLLSSDPSYLFLNDEVQFSREYVRYKLPKRSRLLIRSGTDNPIPARDSDDTSAFAQAILEELQTRNSLFAAPELFVGLRKRLLRETPEFRSITSAGHEVGDFFFVPIDDSARDGTGQP